MYVCRGKKEGQETVDHLLDLYDTLEEKTGPGPEVSLGSFPYVIR